jgi:hypothetical protein
MRWRIAIAVIDGSNGQTRQSQHPRPPRPLRGGTGPASQTDGVGLTATGPLCRIYSKVQRGPGCIKWSLVDRVFRESGNTAVPFRRSVEPGHRLGPHIAWALSMRYICPRRAASSSLALEDRVPSAGMRVTFGLPIYDARPFLTEETGRVMPPWLLVQKSDFVRSFGCGDERAGSHTPWTGEDRFCRGSHALRFVSPLRGLNLGSLDEPRSGFSCSFRGLLATYPTGMFRFEVLLARDRPPPTRSIYEKPLTCLGLVQIIEAVWKLDVKVGSVKNPRPTRLFESGAPLSQHFLRSSTAKSGSEVTPQRWWVGAGTPITVVECQVGEVDGLEQFESVDLGARPFESGLVLFYFKGIGGPVFVAQRRFPRHDKSDLNLLYLHLLRLHTEVESLFCVGRLMLQQPPKCYGHVCMTTAGPGTATLIEDSLA